MIDFRNVHKSFALQPVLVDATFRINPGERVGIVGPNGAGKSTLFNLITREISPDAGEVSLPSNLRTACLHQHTITETNREITLVDYVSDALPRLRVIRDELRALEADPETLNTPLNLRKHGELQHEWEALGGYRMETEAKIALAGLGFRPTDEKRPFCEFSGGWQMRASLARTLIAEPDILLLDEPSNYLDVPAIEWLDRYLSGFRGTLLLISHDRYLLRTLVDTIVEINSCRATRYNCGYTQYVTERDQRKAIAENQRKNILKQRDHLQQFVDRFRYKSSKAAAAQTNIRQIEKLDALLPSIPENLSYAAELKLPPPPHCGTHLLRLQDAGFAYNPPDFIFRHFDFEIAKGEKIAVVGYNGMGKTTLLRIIAGQREPTEGKRTLGHKVILGYQAQEFADILPPEKSVYDVTRSALPPEADTKNLRNLLGAFGFSGDAVDKPVKVLSGGEKIRLCFARIFAAPPNLLVLDEPTTHLDLQARETLQEALVNYEGTVIFVSHDIDFLRNTADTILAVTTEGIKRYPGTYDDYLQKIRTQTITKMTDSLTTETVASSDVGTEDPKERRRRRAEQRQLLSKEKQRLEKSIADAESAIEKHETELETVLNEMADPAPTTDFAALNRKQKSLRDTIETTTAQWEQLTDDYAAFMQEWQSISAD